MGTYNYDENMLIEELANFLDDLQGDFNSKDLKKALEFMKIYAPTSDSTKIQEKIFHKKMKERGIE
jgi:hypothetical protein